VVSELFQRATPLGNPFPALDSCTVLIIHSERPGFLANRVGTSRLEAIFLKVMGWVYGYKGSDSQKIIDMVYCVRPVPSPKYRLIYLRSNPLIRHSMPSPTFCLSERNAWNICARFASRTTCFLDHSRLICPLVRRTPHTVVVDLRTY